MAVGLVVAFTAPLVAGLALAEALAVGLMDGHGLADELALAEAVALGLLELVGLALVEADELADGDAVGVALASATQLACGCSSVALPPPPAAVVPPRNRSAAGTTMRPRMTVMTKASAPHSRSQKAREELRIRVRRPAQAEVYSGY